MKQRGELIVLVIAICFATVLYVYHLNSLVYQMSIRILRLERLALKKLVNPNLNYYQEMESPAPKPSLRILDPEKNRDLDKARKNVYGGKQDMAHLGGFLAGGDNHTISENLWNFILGPLAVKSVVDIGCGIGASTSYFRSYGAKVLCVEGSHDAVSHSQLPYELIVEHDFQRGPWWPKDTYDVAYSTEFLEHVGRHYMKNYLPIMKKSALIFLTTSSWGGWHHVEVHPVWWWVARFEAEGLVYSDILTKKAALQAKNGNVAMREILGEDGRFYSQILMHRLMVFINPAVAQLQQHKHLFGGNGCFSKRGIFDNRDGGERCKGPDQLPPEYNSLLDCSRRKGKTHKDWDHVPWDCVPSV